jgi:hypothetical protein
LRYSQELGEKVRDEGDVAARAAGASSLLAFRPERSRSRIVKDPNADDMSPTQIARQPA